MKQNRREELLNSLDEYLSSISDEEFEEQISGCFLPGIRVDDFFHVSVKYVDRSNILNTVSLEWVNNNTQRVQGRVVNGSDAGYVVCDGVNDLNLELAA